NRPFPTGRWQPLLWSPFSNNERASHHSIDFYAPTVSNYSASCALSSFPRDQLTSTAIAVLIGYTSTRSGFNQSGRSTRDSSILAVSLWTKVLSSPAGNRGTSPIEHEARFLRKQIQKRAGLKPGRVGTTDSLLKRWFPQKKQVPYGP